MERRLSPQTLTRRHDVPQRIILNVLFLSYIFYHYQRDQYHTLVGYAPLIRKFFYIWFQQQQRGNDIASLILVSDEASFGRNGVTNFHNLPSGHITIPIAFTSTILV